MTFPKLIDDAVNKFMVLLENQVANNIAITPWDREAFVVRGTRGNDVLVWLNMADEDIIKDIAFWDVVRVEEKMEAWMYSAEIVPGELWWYYIDMKKEFIRRSCLVVERILRAYAITVG